MVTWRTIRGDFQRRPWWTISEAADFSGLKVRTIRNWLSKHPQLRGLTRGAMAIHAVEFMKFVGAK